MTSTRTGDTITVKGAESWQQAIQAARVLLRPGESLNEQNARIDIQSNTRYFHPRKADHDDPRP